MSALPCRRCLDAMSKWEGPASMHAKPSCRKIGSHQCSRCLLRGHRCVNPAGILKSRGLKLAYILANATDHDCTVKAAQLAVRHVFEGRKEAIRLLALTLAADAKDIMAEVIGLAGEHIVRTSKYKALIAEKEAVISEARELAVEDPASAAELLVGFARSIAERFVEPHELYSEVRDQDP